MSVDGRYLLSYDCQSYAYPTPAEKDAKFLEEEYGGELVRVDRFLYYYEKPKQTLLPEDIKHLMADQVLESRNHDDWEIIK